MTGEGEKTAGVRVRGWALAAAVAIALFVVPVPEWAVDEFYSRDLYPWLQVALTTISNFVPFALLDLMIGFAATLFIVRAGILLFDLRRRSAASVLWEGLRRTVRAVALVAIVFMVVWGWNYRRIPLEATLAGGQAIRPDEAVLVPV